MIPRSFEYFAPRSVKDATRLLKKHGSDAKVLAGGMSLIPVLKLRLASPSYIVDINRIPGLEYIKISGKRMMIGALTRHHDLETSRAVREKLPLLSETAAQIGDPQVRNRGTIGGSICHSDPSGDWGAALLAVRGEVTLRGPTKERKLKIDDFLVDTFTSALKPSELLTQISIPIPPPGSGGTYMKLERKTGDFATVGVAVQLSVDAKNVCKTAGIGLTALGPKNLRAEKAEHLLVGRVLTPAMIDEVAIVASEESQPYRDPLRGSAEYKKEMTRVYTRRALERAFARAKGGKS